ncbi:MAG: hypothetical protein DMG12_13055 [Acidobacteria bacterium]|nr:MAG: hypothetical protein DMG12_13055 [Acidobacteriota bacterium]
MASRQETENSWKSLKSCLSAINWMIVCGLAMTFAVCRRACRLRATRRPSFSTSLIHDMPGRNSPSRSDGSDISAFDYLLTYQILFSV